MQQMYFWHRFEKELSTLAVCLKISLKVHGLGTGSTEGLMFLIAEWGDLHVTTVIYENRNSDD